MKQQKAKLTKTKSTEMLIRMIAILIGLSHSCSLLFAPVDALMSVRQIRSSRGGNPMSPCPTSTNAPKLSHVCTFATTFSTTITEEDVKRKSQKITHHDVSKKRRARSETLEINGSKAWELRLYNDENNFEFWVAEQLVKIVGLSEREAFDTMKSAGITGQATIGSYDCFELAEYYHTALQAEGLAVKLLPVL